MFEVNDRAVIYILYEYKLMHQICLSKENIADAYAHAGFNYGNIRWEKLPNNENGRLGWSFAFAKVGQRYYELQFSFDNCKAEHSRLITFLR